MKSTYSFEKMGYQDDECMICLETMHEPVTLQCGHNSCLGCTLKSTKKLKSNKKSKATKESEIICALCRKVHQVKDKIEVNKEFGHKIEKKLEIQQKLMLTRDEKWDLKQDLKNSKLIIK